MPSPTEVAALQGLILRLSVVAGRSVTQLFSSANSEQMKQAYPDVVDPFLSAAGTLSAEWYDSLAPESTFDTRPSLLPARDVLSASVGWAFSQINPLAAMIGTTERHIFTTSRTTVVENAQREGVRFARYASANACAWCRVLATREPVYKSAENSTRGHDNCHCMAVPVRAGDTYTPPDYVKGFLKEYNTARAEVGGNLNDIVNKMRSTQNVTPTPSG